MFVRWWYVGIWVMPRTPKRNKTATTNSAMAPHVRAAVARRVAEIDTVTEVPPLGVMPDVADAAMHVMLDGV